MDESTDLAQMVLVVISVLMIAMLVVPFAALAAWTRRKDISRRIKRLEKRRIS